MKVCKQCEVPKEESEYYRINKIYLYSICKSCLLDNRKEKYHKLPKSQRLSDISKSFKDYFKKDK